MNAKNRTRRFWIGLALLLVVLIGGFTAANLLIPGWGSTPAERSQVLPGDEIFDQPVMTWQHAITIDAAPETVWPWLIQMGDTRGGFYSYRYIEKAVTAMAGVDTSLYYRNTNSIHPEWQTPAIGQGMLLDTLVLRDYQPNRYLVAAPAPGADQAGLLWTWFISPVEGGRTRLQVHIAIQIPGMAGNQAIETAANLATFMMERKMMEGIKLRAEGGMEADWVQAAEALLWVVTLGLGLVAARRFLTRSTWLPALLTGLAAIALLFALTYLQPALWLRGVGVLALVAALVGDGRMAWRAALRPAAIKAR